ncbi:hypothetical protein WM22_27140 [Burkholderia ubonensis]|nr:hypothetical protein WJ97_02005 [Burkholderia ubonensis]KWC09296.1 hypothetical protein WL47_29710 [Burkholderia ubonensis]KWI41949.1 hypothetical protein WM05_23985 [Burkholderia ubonensis]KWN28258.1 hypothetical protein WM22_27140 [Burkholderia ubonensis]
MPEAQMPSFKMPLVDTCAGIERLARPTREPRGADRELTVFARRSSRLIAAGLFDAALSTRGIAIRIRPKSCEHPEQHVFTFIAGAQQDPE